jgi:hypothetical protein
MQVMDQDNKDGDAANGIELRDFFLHGRHQPLNSQGPLNGGRLEYSSIVGEVKGQFRNAGSAFTTLSRLSS